MLEAAGRMLFGSEHLVELTIRHPEKEAVGNLLRSSKPFTCGEPEAGAGGVIGASGQAGGEQVRTLKQQIFI